MDKRKLYIRIILFVLAVAVAAGAFGLGVSSLGKREEGWYDIDYTDQTKAVLYASDVRLTYHLSGTSGEIRQRTTALSRAYSEALLKYYKLLDAENVYDDSVSIASISAADGQPVAVDEALYAVLEDALARTERGEGYSLFSGALHAEWEGIRYLEEPADFDPLNNMDERERLTALTEMTNRDGLFSLVLDEDGHTAAFSAGDDWRRFADENEISASPLDLNLMRDAYLLDLTGRALIEAGFTDGYLYTDAGLTYILGGEGPYYADVLAPDGAGGVMAAGTLAVPSPGAACRTTAAATEKTYGWYAIEREGRTYLRHPWLDARTGDFPGGALTAALVSGDMGLVELNYRAICLNAASGEELTKLIDNYSGDCDIVVSLQGASKGDVIVSRSAIEDYRPGKL